MAQGGGVRRRVGGLAPGNCRAPAARQRDVGGDRKTPPDKMCENNPCTVETSWDYKGLQNRKPSPLARLPGDGGEGSARWACAVGQNRTIRASSQISVIQKSQALPRQRLQAPAPALHPRLRPCKRTAHRCRPRSPASRLAAGPVAQWLEPAAHNGLVAGSSPAGPTSANPIRSLALGHNLFWMLDEMKRLPEAKPFSALSY
ncbi:hypothetical protein ABIB68_006491 [Bradyrhizobium sp. F1.2.2]